MTATVAGSREIGRRPRAVLGCPTDTDVAGLDDRLHDPGPAGVEVDIGPAQPEGLPSTHARRREQDPECKVAIIGVPGGVEELSQGR